MRSFSASTASREGRPPRGLAGAALCCDLLARVVVIAGAPGDLVAGRGIVSRASAVIAARPTIVGIAARPAVVAYRWRVVARRRCVVGGARTVIGRGRRVVRW